MARQQSGSKQFGTLVRAAREDAGLTGDELAKKIGMGHRFMWALERGECSIQPSRLDLLCKVLPKLETYRDIAPKPSRLAAGEDENGKHKNGADKTEREDPVMSFVRAAKQIGIAKAFELVKVLEAIARVEG